MVVASSVVYARVTAYMHTSVTDLMDNFANFYMDFVSPWLFVQMNCFPLCSAGFFWPHQSVDLLGQALVQSYITSDSMTPLHDSTLSLFSLPSILGQPCNFTPQNKRSFNMTFFSCRLEEERADQQTLFWMAKGQPDPQPPTSQSTIEMSLIDFAVTFMCVC